jgi:hypothetical protein
MEKRVTIRIRAVGQTTSFDMDTTRAERAFLVRMSGKSMAASEGEQPYMIVRNEDGSMLID